MITVYTEYPLTLLSSIKSGIDEGRIRTWSHDTDGDFTHTAEQWNRQAWLRPKQGEGRLFLSILTPKGKKLSRTVYAVYHGRFVEMLLAHFDKDFERVTTSALASSSDRV